MSKAAPAPWLAHERALSYLLVLVALAFVPGAGSAFVLPKVFVLIVGTLIVTAFALTKPGSFIPKRKNLAISVLILFWIGILCASLRSYSVYSAIFGEYNRFNGLATYTAFVLLAFSVSRLFSIDRIHNLGKPILVAGILIALYGFLQLAGLDPIDWVITSSSYISFLGNSNFVSAFLGIAGVVSFLLFIIQEKKSRNQFVYFFITIFMIFAVVMSVSQQGFFSFAAGVAVILLVYAFQKSRKIFYVAFVGSLFAGIGVILGLLGFGPLTGILRQGTLAYRADYMWAGWQMALDKPLTGIGLDLYGDYFREYRSLEQVLRFGPELISNDAHSIPIQMAASGGFGLFAIYVGTLLFITAIGLFNVLRSYGANQLVNAGLLGTWLAYAVQAGVSIENPAVGTLGWISAGALMGVFIRGRNDEKSNPTPRRKLATKISTGMTLGAAFTISIFAIYSLVSDSQINTALNYTLASQDDASINLHVNKIENAIKMNQNEPELLMKVAQKYLSYGIVDGGKFYIKKSLDKNPRYYPALNAEAVVAESEKNYELARRYRERNLSYDPHNFENQLGLTRIFLTERDLAKAKNIYESMFKLSENSPYTKQAQELIESFK